MIFLFLKSRRKMKSWVAPKVSNTTMVNTLYHKTRELVDSVVGVGVVGVGVVASNTHSSISW